MMMKKIIMTSLVLIFVHVIKAQDEFPLHFSYGDGSIIPNDTTLIFTEYKIDDFGDVFVPTNLYVKNTSDDEVIGGGTFTITKITNGRFQTCFPENCISKTKIGTYNSEYLLIPSGNLRNTQTVWFPFAPGELIVTFQLLTYKKNYYSYIIDREGPKITLKFEYDPNKSYNGKCGDNLNYNYELSTKTLTVSGTGTMYDFDYGGDSSAPWAAYFNDISKIIIEDGVTSIGARAFYNCSGLEEVYCYSSSAPSTGEYSFVKSFTEKAVLYIPDNGIDSYLDKSPWVDFGKIITFSGTEVTISDVNTQINCSVDWNGSQSSSVTPWGSRYARGVDLVISNYSDVSIIINKIEAYTNTTNIGTLDVENIEIAHRGGQKTISFSISKSDSMPSTLPWLKIYYKIGAKEFVKDSREPSSSGIYKNTIENADISNIYTLEGKTLDKPRKGLNIVKMSDGTTKKVIVK